MGCSLRTLENALRITCKVVHVTQTIASVNSTSFLMFCTDDMFSFRKLDSFIHILSHSEVLDRYGRRDTMLNMLCRPCLLFNLPVSFSCLFRKQENRSRKKIVGNVSEQYAAEKEQQHRRKPFCDHQQRGNIYCLLIAEKSLY